MVKRFDAFSSGQSLWSMKERPAGQWVAFEDYDRLRRLLDMRPPYYCQKCDCASCGNTRVVPTEIDRLRACLAQLIHLVGQTDNCGARKQLLDEAYDLVHQ